MRAFILGLALAASLPVWASQHGLVKWENDPTAAFARAKAEKKMLWVYFTADW